jgi:thymidylate synthase ThyX
MTISAKIIAHSKCTAHPVELYTLEVTLPRSLVAQINTHRALSRNSASSRAIPIAKMIDAVEKDPYVPVFRQNAKGMQPGAALPWQVAKQCRRKWKAALSQAVGAARHMANLGAAKEDVNRLLEPWMWSTIVLSGTDWRGFFAQRLPGAGAQHGIAELALAMKTAMDESTPQVLEPGQWHKPYGGTPEQSAAHCARVSYTKQGTESTPEKLAEVYQRLVGSSPGHWSPLEHPAMAMETPSRCRNFRGWQQLRAVVDKGQWEEA